MADYEKVKEDKILAILFLDKNEEKSKSHLLKLPLYLKTAWQSSATLKICDTIDSKDVADNFGINKVPSMMVWEK